MITRKEYMKSSNDLHHAYWLEVAQSARLSLPKALIDGCRENITRDLKAHFNSTPLASWDHIAETRKGELHSALKARGDGWSLACGACAGKALARDLLEKEGLSLWWPNDSITWAPIASELHDEMLCALPPTAREREGFLLGEASDHRETGTQYPTPRYRAFAMINGRAYEASRPLSIYQFNNQMHHAKAVQDLREALVC